MQTSDTSVVKGIVGIIGSITVLVFFYCYFQYSLNIPWFDDIENIPYFLANWVEGNGFAEKWSALLRPNNEHRVLYARTIVLIQYYLTGSIQFQVLGFIGNISIVIIALLIGLNYRRQGGKWYHLLPVVFLLFNLQSYAGIYMTIMSLQYQVVIMLSMLAFYLLSSTKKYAFGLAILVGYIDTFSMGNGMLVWPAGVLMLLFLSEWRNAVIWTILGGLAIFLYFYGFDFVQGNDRAIDYLKQYPVRTFISFFTMLGGDFDVVSTLSFAKRMVIPTLAGLVLVLILLVWTLSLLKNNKRFSSFLSSNYLDLPYSTSTHIRSNAFWFATIAYTVGGILLVVLLRTRFDYQLVLWSTYKMYPAVITSIVYLIVIQNVGMRYKSITLLIGSVITFAACVMSYVNFLPEVYATQRIRMAFAHNQLHNDIGLGAEKGSPFETMVQQTFERAANWGFYQLPSPFIHPDELNIDLSKAQSSEALLTTEAQPNALTVKVPTITEQDDAYLVLQSAHNRYLFAINRTLLQANCPLTTIRPGTYQVGIWKVQASGSTLTKYPNEIKVD